MKATATNTNSRIRTPDACSQPNFQSKSVAHLFSTTVKVEYL